MFLFLACLVLKSNTYAQLLNIPTIGNEVIRENRYSDVEGSPYLYNSWRSASIIDNIGKEYQNKSIKYDCYKDVIELNQDGNILVLNSQIYPKFEISFIADENNKIVKRIFKSGYKVNGYKEGAYFEVLYEGLFSFVKKIKIEFVDETVNSYGTSTRIKRFLSSEKYFLIDQAGISKELKLKRSSLLEALGSSSNNALKYINENKIKVKGESDVIEILNHLN